jgi:hypothetical protein
VGEVSGLAFRSNATLLDGTGLLGHEFAAGKRFGEPVDPTEGTNTSSSDTSAKERVGLGLDTIHGNLFLSINGDFIGVGFRGIFNELISVNNDHTMLT